MGGRGSASGNAMMGRTRAQNSKISEIIEKTANLKNEQTRIIDKNGNVIYEEKLVSGRYVMRGDLNYDGNVVVTNHPDGHMFNPSDLVAFGLGAKELVMATPDAVYRLINDDINSRWEGLANEISEVNRTPRSMVADVEERLSRTPEARRLKEIEDTLQSLYRRTDAYGGEEFSRYYDKVASERLKLQDKVRETRKIIVRQAMYDEPVIETLKKNAKWYGFRFIETKRNRSV